jgi:hypothetical protein
MSGKRNIAGPHMGSASMGSASQCRQTIRLGRQQRAPVSGIGPETTHRSVLRSLRTANRRLPPIEIAGPRSFESHSHIFFTVISGRLPPFKVCKISPALSSSSRVTMEEPMDWLFTDENIATAIVIVGFCLFLVVLVLLSRS